LEIIDIHTHLGAIRSSGRGLRGWVHVSVDDLLDYMDACGISIAVVLPIQKVKGIGEDLWLTEDVLRACRSHPDRLIPFCVVDPLAGDAGKKVEAYAKAGCGGFGEHRVPLPVDHPANLALYSVCQDLGMPLLIEIGDLYNFDFDAFVEVTSRFPKLTFIAHGPGWWREISAVSDKTRQYPSGPVVRGGGVEKALSERRNLFADISATSGYNALSRDTLFSKEFVERFSNRLMFGTDFPGIDLNGLQDGPNMRHISLLRELGVSDRSMEKILSGNASSILGI